jgi:hypothetical protein
MASKLFRAMVAQTKETKGLDSILAGSSYLGEGEHEVVINSVDVSKADSENYIFVEYSAGGKSHKDLISLFNREQTEIGYGIKSLLAATIPDSEAVAAFFAIEEDNAFEMLTGMKLKVELAYGKGFRISSTGGGKFVAVDTETGEQIVSERDTVDEAKLEAEAAGHRRAFIRVRGRKACNAEQNVEILKKAIENRGKAAPKTTFSTSI